MERQRLTPDAALASFLRACNGDPNEPEDDRRWEQAWDAMDDLNHWLTTKFRVMPDGRAVIDGLISEGYLTKPRGINQSVRELAGKIVDDVKRKMNE